jgi:hypothetical protein
MNTVSIPVYTTKRTYPVSDDSDNPDCALWGERTESKIIISYQIWASHISNYEVYDPLSCDAVLFRQKSTNVSEERAVSIFVAK